MPTIFIINGILISMFGFDHNPPHIHVRYGEFKFTITLKERLVKGYAPASIISEVNEFINSHIEELEILWEKAVKGEQINKISH